MAYEPKTFVLPELEGLSKESIEAHLGLYAGYVKNFNAIEVLLADLLSDSDLSTGSTGLTTSPLGAGKYTHASSELVRRLPFEFDGMRLHEYYFSQWEGGAKMLDQSSTLTSALATQYGSYENWEKQFKSVGMMRGPGWALLYYDTEAKRFHNVWVEQHHQGHFATLPIILALDVWEHAFITDYGTAGRSKYIEACFKNYNWSVLEKRFSKAIA